jgi:hypothetical protein
MKPFKLKLGIALLAFLIGIASFFVWDGFKLLPNLVQTSIFGSPHSNDISLQISPQNTSVKVDEEIHLKFTISNNGSDSVTLVNPGDGSEHAWRTPIVQWSILKTDTATQHPAEPVPSDVPRCGMMNSLEAKEVFSLAAGETRELQNWEYLSSFKEPGVYRVVFLYSNKPSLQWKDELSFSHNLIALWRAKHSTETTIASNEIIFTVSE